MADYIEIEDFGPKPIGSVDSFTVNAIDILRSKYPANITISSVSVAISVDPDSPVADVDVSDMITGASGTVNASTYTAPNGKSTPAGYIAAKTVNGDVGEIGAIYILTYTLILSVSPLKEIVRGRFKLVA